MNVGLRGAVTMYASFHEIVSQNTHFVTSVITFSSVLDVSVSEALPLITLYLRESENEIFLQNMNDVTFFSPHGGAVKSSRRWNLVG